MRSPARFTDEEKQNCALREVRWRKRVYPNRVETGRMSREEADREIALMTEIADDYRVACELPLG